MIEVIPAVLPLTEEELITAVRRLEAAGVERMHLDICDGDFVSTRTIDGYLELMRLNTKILVDVHLMVKSPEQYVDHWWACECVERFIVHVESTHMFDVLRHHAHSHDQEVVATLNPDTPLEKLDALEGYDGVQFMTVHPGLQGQDFLPDVMPKISRFSKKYPEMPIFVDGGITPATAPQCVAAGATALISGSYILGHDNIEEAIKQIQG